MCTDWLDIGLGGLFSSAESLTAWSTLAAVVVAALGFGATAWAVFLAARQLRLEALPIIVVRHELTLEAPLAARIRYLTLGRGFRDPLKVAFNESHERPELPTGRILCQLQNAGRTAAIDLLVRCTVRAKIFNYQVDLGQLLPGESVYLSLNADGLQELETVFYFKSATCQSIFGKRTTVPLYGCLTVSMFNEGMMRERQAAGRKT